MARGWRAVADAGTARRARPSQPSVAVRLLGHVIGRRLHATAAEQKLLALLLQHLVRLLRREVEPVLVDDPLRVFDPLLPGPRGDRVVDALAQGIVERLVGQARELLAEFCALDHTAHARVDSTKTATTGPTTPLRLCRPCRSFASSPSLSCSPPRAATIPASRTTTRRCRRPEARRARSPVRSPTRRSSFTAPRRAASSAT